METIPLWPGQALSEGAQNEVCPSYTPYLLQGEGPHPLMIVCPGGGYAMRAFHEGEPIAQWLNAIGVSAIVLHYRVAPYKHPVPLQDAQRAIRTARHRATEWRIDPRRIGILGFSAGGHLASSAGTRYDGGDSQAADPIERMSSRPDLMVLCYPVITMKPPYTHEGSRTLLLGESPEPALVDLMSNDEQVTEDTPPTFLWHTADDAGVPVENSLNFAAALSRNRVPHELHVYESGRHGLGLAEETPGVRDWSRACGEWLQVRGFR
ncbi:alpha/beta hydrolase [Cohnella zeiphila]|uniref:Alpha/beta hydrolase n=1 Tax=Cohnella zeiphila TaxID=2761120 RepID=A0A7X0STX0_9BACL|nr:alpha/beta hydrolase [Cohnella zeiphila]MBB6735059.1 alpha/beta hydrolase [Cohnella zeiphila]